MQWALKTKSSCWQMFLKGVLNNFAIFTETHLCWSPFFKRLEVNLLKKRLQHRDFLVNILKHTWRLLPKNPWHFRFIWKIGWLPGMFASWLSQIMLLFCLSYWNPALWCCIAIFQKLPFCQLQTVHLVDSLIIGERPSESNTFLCSVVH